MSFAKRSNMNPLIKPSDVKPSREDFKVDGVFNCGVCKYDDEYLLLCRVAESVKVDKEDEVKIPVVVNIDGKDVIDIVSFNKEIDTQYDYSDARSLWITHIGGVRKIAYLTSLSHIRIARSKDGENFIIEDEAFIKLTASEEEWGMEDPRITKIEDTYYVNYTSVTRNGAATSLVSTKDFKTYERHGIIFAPENKDVTIFPEKINGKYITFNRPVPCAIGGADMWIAESPDLVHWGKQKHFYGGSNEGAWENGRVGGGAVPFLTEKGWIKIYHAADKNDRYCLGAFLLDKNDPSKILAKTSRAILEPKATYEKEGFFGNVVFTCGCLFEDGIVKIYYGAADDKVCRADIKIEDIFTLMDK
ncbi:glycoside hydrolase family 130 protein [Clostridium sp. CM028]|uniref:glycoside hydrolase family 130 protein n=1 Tax=unclassified Clostridium TaxID=2614128 RepID=UPI001C0CE71B|nr:MULTISPECIES: glycoside hydrolase family 130 protein [unclassified Clostridium]MBU3092605.1 glycoside hydrolase family 130 protein [Clostridium sp. CF011]MBW9146194.1 glycoside hydrolase family 130 protein [Clostridium sp. CM027]MBW9149666.1 glycoside hydrolase family 130 protein [Clostridium sp. CM028]UVE39826.1 glycoside hydrolase family 130 protein [Clostridium sp. CM027]WAG68733.1 glycoside hydrolase family 130 protein [Clostridium sp. CF011]